MKVSENGRSFVHFLSLSQVTMAVSGLWFTKFRETTKGTRPYTRGTRKGTIFGTSEHNSTVVVLYRLGGN